MSHCNMHNAVLIIPV